MPRYPIQVEVVPSIAKVLNSLLPKESDFIVALKKFMAQTVCVSQATHNGAYCGRCTKVIQPHPIPQVCPHCAAQWQYVLPCFMYYANRPLQPGQRPQLDHENFCREIAPRLEYVASVGLARIAPPNRQAYNLEATWYISI